MIGDMGIIISIFPPKNIFYYIFSEFIELFRNLIDRFMKLIDM